MRVHPLFLEDGPRICLFCVNLFTMFTLYHKQCAPLFLTYCTTPEDACIKNRAFRLIIQIAHKYIQFLCANQYQIKLLGFCYYAILKLKLMLVVHMDMQICSFKQIIITTQTLVSSSENFASFIKSQLFHSIVLKICIQML